MVPQAAATWRGSAPSTSCHEAQTAPPDIVLEFLLQPKGACSRAATPPTPGVPAPDVPATEGSAFHVAAPHLPTRSSRVGVWPVSPLSTLSARDLSQAISPVHSGGASGLPGERVLAVEALGRAPASPGSQSQPRTLRGGPARGGCPVTAAGSSPQATPGPTAASAGRKANAPFCQATRTSRAPSRLTPLLSRGCVPLSEATKDGHRARGPPGTEDTDPELRPRWAGRRTRPPASPGVTH